MYHDVSETSKNRNRGQRKTRSRSHLRANDTCTTSFTNTQQVSTPNCTVARRPTDLSHGLRDDDVTSVELRQRRKPSDVSSAHDVATRKTEVMRPQSKDTRRQRRKELQEKFGKKNMKEGLDVELGERGAEKEGCTLSLIFDPSGRLSYWWSAVVSVAFLYNLWAIFYRFSFEEINHDNRVTWFSLDYSCDFIYILDVLFHFRVGYLEDGVLVTNTRRLRVHYLSTTVFYIDVLCLLPLDMLYLSFSYNSAFRCVRLVKIYRFWGFLDRTERHTNYPNLMRAVMLFHYLLVLYHCNASVLFLVAKKLDNLEAWNFPTDDSTFSKYLHSVYLSLQILTLTGGPSLPRRTGEYVFIICQTVFAMIVFATVLGNISNIVSNISAARKDFQGELAAAV